MFNKHTVSLLLGPLVLKTNKFKEVELGYKMKLARIFKYNIVTEVRCDGYQKSM